jgi:hypothetical protein
MSAHDVYDAPPPRNPADLSDTELQALLQRETLSETSRAAVLAELATRGLPPAVAAAVETPAVAQDPAPAAGSFAENPYQPPRSALAPADAARTWTRAREVLWWVHIGLTSLMVVRMAYVAFFVMKTPPMGRLLPVSLGLSCIGLVGWRLGRRLLWRGVWIAQTAIAWIFLTAMVVGGLVAVLIQPAGWPGRFSGLLLLATYPLLAGLAWGINRYTFHSPTIWR